MSSIPPPSTRKFGLGTGMSHARLVVEMLNTGRGSSAVELIFPFGQSEMLRMN